jgi:hypothetical protein
VVRRFGARAAHRPLAEQRLKLGDAGQLVARWRLPAARAHVVRVREGPRDAHDADKPLELGHGDGDAQHLCAGAYVCV